jgi:eukaryotic-like serine/threonine-protein kinase
MKVCPNCQRSFPNSFAVCPQDGGRLAESLEWTAGTVVRGKYRIEAKIGEGGMGAVYKALHVHFNEACALKVMSPNLANDAALVKRFGREAIIARKLRHKNAVKVDDFDEAEDGRPFIVMEYIEGQSLKSLMTAAGPLPASRTCSIIKQAAAALDAAHELGLIHRDIKPDNIVLVISHGEEIAKVLDFGIAKIRDARGDESTGVSLTATGMIIGTPPYMSPEQARGADSEGIDGRSDIYSLGVVMYQMLTGILPLKGNTPMDMLFAQMQTPPTPIHEARPGLRISAPLGAVVMKCLEKDPARRPQSGRELIEELERAEKAQASAPQSPSVKDFSESTTVASTPAQFPRTAASPSATTFGSDSVAYRVDGPEAGGASAAPRVSSVAAVPGLVVAREESSSAATGPVSGGVSPKVESKSGASRSGVIALVVIVIVAAGAGGWYFFGRPSVKQNSPSGSNVAIPEASQPSASPSTSPQGVVAPDSSNAEPSRTQSGPSSAPASSSQPKAAARDAVPAGKPLSADEKAARVRRVSATTSLGDLYFENGEYDNAIKEYQLGLDADPSNKLLLERLDRARKGKDAAQSAKP